MKTFTATDSPVKYWSNACGEVHYHGEYDITVGELPSVLRKAYKKYWSERYPLPCYLGEVEENFCLFFILEADENYVEELFHCDIDASLTILQQLAQRLEKYSAFSCADFIIEEGTGFDGCHQLIISIPASIEEETFGRFVKALGDHFYGGDTMSENYIVINGKKAELTPEQLKALGIEVKKPSPFEMGEEDSEYYFLNSFGATMKTTMRKDNNSDLRHRVANYCTDEELLLQQAYRETLNRLLWRFSMEHDGNEIDWSDKQARKWKIKFVNNHLTVEWNIDDRIIGCVYFHTCEIAKQAVEEIVKPFVAAHPDFRL